MKFYSICIFTQAGHTFTFNDVELLCDNESVLKFGYTAMSDDKVKVGIFLKHQIVGWSFTHVVPKSKR
jgi:hypothetical protein